MRREETPKAADVKKGIAVLWETLQCPICLELMTGPVSTKCDHQFCKFCMMKLLDSSKHNRASCPVCKARVTRRSLQDSPGFRKLVAALQDMIHAYEHDTGTSYFTGLMLPNHPKIVADAEIQKHNANCEDLMELDKLKNAICDDVSESQSSTVKAQNGFARLMEFEDSSPLTTENEGLDSGLGEPPPAAARQKCVPKDTLELITTEEPAAVENGQLTNKARTLIDPSDLPPLILEEETGEDDKNEAEEELDESALSLRKLSRKKRKKDSDPDKILKHRQKKSVEKVREWLKSVPSEEDIELNQSDLLAPDLNDSDSFSSASTIDLSQQNLESFMKEKDEPAKALEDQVFGAVYKRDKKRNGKLSPPHVLSTHLSSKDEMQPLEDESKSEADKESEINLADDCVEFVPEPHMDTEEQNEPHCEIQPDQKLNNELKNINKKCKEKDAHSPPQMETRKLRANGRKIMRNALGQVDSDLQEHAKSEPENGEQKKTEKRKGRQTRPAKVKSRRVTKPLDLVEVQNVGNENVPMKEQTPKLESKQVQVHIENYPSSEDQDAVVKSSRRSKRLQTFVEEIKVNKNKSRQTKVTKPDIGVASEEVSLGKKNASPKSAKPNGCIYDDDLGGIEKMGSGECPNILKPSQPLQEVPNVDIPSEGGCSESTVQHISKSPGALDEVSTVQESNFQTEPNNTHFESLGCVDEEEDDSEIDTEQLLKSFKASKRKSFHLEAPNVKRSRTVDDSVLHKSEHAGALEEDTTAIHKTHQSDSSLHLSDVIPPSATQNKARCQEDLDVSKKQIFSNVVKSSTSEALSPNKATTFETPSPRLSVIPQVVNSGLCFTAPHMSDCVEPKKQSEIEPSKCSHISESQYSKAEEDSVSLLDPATTTNRSPGKLSERLVNPENSLTPDGLHTSLPALHVDVANSHGSSSAQSSVKNHPKRRRSRRLESSPELDSEELPGLCQILNRDTSGGRGTSQQENCDSLKVNKQVTADEGPRPPQCPSPDYVNSSQASVDLFGTPEESTAFDVNPVNPASASMELSQFSSEVLVTQQKIEMQEELLRLEKLMALVSEVLHEKEKGPENNQRDTKKNDKLEAGLQPCNEAAEQNPESAEKNRTGSSEAKAAPKPSVTKQGCTADTARQGLGVSKGSTPPQSSKNRESPSEDKENNTPPNERKKHKMVLASSGLGSSEQTMVKKFAKRIGSRVVSQVTPDVTHIIMHTDEQLVCERTLKYFLGIAGRKWVVSFQWIAECFKQKKLVDESHFEVRGDVVNGHNHQGPMRARTTHEDDLLMKGFNIYFQGPFSGMTTEEMGWMVELCGATVVKDPFVLDNKQKSRQLVIVQSGSDISASKYNSLSKVATVVTRGWLLDSVSAYTMQNSENYAI